MRNTFYNLCNVKYGIAELNYLSLRCIKLQFFSVLASTSVWKVLGFDSRAIQIGHSVTYDSLPLQRFFTVVRSCWPGRLAMSLIYILNVTRDSNENFS